MKKLLTFIGIACYFLITSLRSIASEEVRDLYLLVLNLEENQTVRKQITELAKLNRFTVPESGLYFGKMTDFPKNTLRMVRMDFSKFEDKASEKQITGAIHGHLCREDIGKQTVFGIIEQETLYQREGYSQFEVEKILKKLKSESSGTLEPLIYIHVLELGD